MTVIMCSGLYFMPQLKEAYAAAIETVPEVLVQETPIEIEESVVVKDKKLNIELPEGIDGEDVRIVNDYVNNTLYVRFAKAVDNYSQNYIVRGSSTHIANLSYYKEMGEGVLEIKLDKPCEHFYSYEDGFLKLELKDLHEVYEKIVVVDAGHGGSQPGAVKREVYEKHINLAIVLELKALFDEVEDGKIKVLYTRLEDTNPSLAERVEMANKLNANLFISVHNNSTNDGKFSSVNGTMVLYSPDENDDSSKRLAEICLANVNASTGSKNKGLMKADNIYIVKNSNVPVALIEVGYMTNHNELDNLCSKDYQKKAAQGIYNAIMQAFEEGF